MGASDTLSQMEGLLQTLLEPDERGRVSLARVPGANADRYLARRMADGTVILEPVVVLPVRALDSLQHALLARARRESGQGSTTPLETLLPRPPSTTSATKNIRSPRPTRPGRRG